MPIVSIIVRTCNRPKLLPRALQSIQRQTFSDYEVLLVNDGGSRERVEAQVARFDAAFQQRVRIVHHPAQQGIPFGLNTGLEHASGEFIAIHDDDDTWEPGFLSAMASALRHPSQPQVRGVVCQTRLVVEEMDDKGRVRLKYTESFNALDGISLWEMGSGNQFPPISMLYRRDVHDEVGGFDTTLPVLEDWDFNLRFLCHYDMDVLPQTLANYHHREPTGKTPYGNTVVEKLDTHAIYDSALRNRYLRQDLKTGNFGLGFMMNLSRGNALVVRQMGEQVRASNEEVQHLIHSSTMLMTGGRSIQLQSSLPSEGDTTSDSPSTEPSEPNPPKDP